MQASSLHHIGYVVLRIGPALSRFVAEGALVLVEPVDDPIQRVTVALLAVDEVLRIELVAPIPGLDSPITARLRRGGGLDHVCLSVPDVRAALDAEVGLGAVELCAPVHAVAFDRTIAFVQRRSGMVVELISDDPERAEPAGPVAGGPARGLRTGGGRLPDDRGGLVDRHLDDDDPAWGWAQRALGYVRQRHPEGIEGVLEGFATVSIDFIRLQARFMKTGHYALSSAAGLERDLYGDEEKMRGYYLDGLAMTYALWPNHARMLGFMAERFASQLAPGSRVVEVGVGHGLMASVLLDLVPDLTYVGVDISASSLAYASAALRDQQIDPDRWVMVNADAVQRDLTHLGGSGGFDALLCCEVLEHVEAPDALLRNLRASVRPTGRAFVSTVANLEAEDHVFLFHDADHIEATISSCGWVVDAALPSVLPGAESWRPLPVNYSAVLEPGALRRPRRRPAVAAPGAGRLGCDVPTGTHHEPVWFPTRREDA